MADTLASRWWWTQTPLMQYASPLVRAAAAAALVALAACSFSYSSESISGSIEASSKSSSSSSPGEKETAYRDDVRDYTVAYIRSSENSRAFLQGLSNLARRHGVTAWESERLTWVGIGQGLARARVSGAALDAFKRSLAETSPAHQAAIQEGYDGGGAS